MLPVPSCVDHPCARGESIGGCAEHGQVPMMVRMDFGSRSRENNDSDCNDVNIYGYEYDSMDERYCCNSSELTNWNYSGVSDYTSIFPLLVVIKVSFRVKHKNNECYRQRCKTAVHFHPASKDRPQDESDSKISADVGSSIPHQHTNIELVRQHTPAVARW
jgi:hypothetical protein